VILVTNRDGVLDPAVRRRTALHLKFARPDATARAAVFARLLEGVPCNPDQIEGLVGASDRPSTAYSYSDLVDRLARGVLREAQRRDAPISPELMLECLARLEPTPLIEASK
jgi:AAA+ superfamily predicted ATPase